VAVGSHALKKFQNRSNWVNIFDAAKDFFDDFVDVYQHLLNLECTPDEFDIIAQLEQAYKNSNFSASLKQFVYSIKELNPNSTFRNAFEPVILDLKKYAKQCDAAVTIHSIAVVFGNKVYENMKGRPYFPKNAFDKYPMLSFVGSIRMNTYNNTPLDKLFDYINLIDWS
jgi:hypothetical protein